MPSCLPINNIHLQLSAGDSLETEFLIALIRPQNSEILVNCEHLYTREFGRGGGDRFWLTSSSKNCFFFFGKTNFLLTIYVIDPRTPVSHHCLFNCRMVTTVGPGSPCSSYISSWNLNSESAILTCHPWVPID